jgi:predicted ester cyclase
MKNQALAAAALALPLLAAAPARAEAPEALVQPAQTILDPSLPAATAQALAADFVDHTLPAGRPQGPEGPIAASAGFRQAVPDLRAEVGQMIVAGDRVSVFLHFTGHFTGTFGGHQGKGQAIDFIAMDIYRIRDGRIAEDWHLEDNLTLLKQMDAVATR